MRELPVAALAFALMVHAVTAAPVSAAGISGSPSIAVDAVSRGNDSYSTKINNTLSVPVPGVLANDGGATSAQLYTPAAHGTVVLSSNGAFTYTPAVDFTGLDMFTYRASDGVTSVAVQVFINVTATARGTLSSSTSVCKGDSTSLHVDLTGEPPFIVSWTDGLVQSASTARVSRVVQPEVSTSYRIVRIQDRNGPGPISPSAASVSVNIRPAPPSIQGLPFLELNEPLSLTASTPHNGYQWYRNGAPIAGATNRTFELPAAGVGDGGIYTVTGRNTQCPSYPSQPVAVEVAAKRIVPVIGSANGLSGSVFRSSIQIHNDADAFLGGTIDFFGAQPGPHGQTLFGLDARGTGAITDVSSILGAESLGSIDIDVPLGPAIPTSVVRVYNDGGELGTTGVTVPQIRPRDVLRGGDRAVLITPANLEDFRYNIGIRTLQNGVEMNVRSYSADGQLRMVVGRSFPPNSFRQLRAVDLMAVPLTANEVLTFEIVSGAAVVYGTAVENRTNDPSLQIAEKIRVESKPVNLIVPAVASITGGFGSWFKTAMQIHNPGNKTQTIVLGFRPAQQIAGGPLKSRTYKILAQETLTIDDVLPALGTSGIGSLDITSSGDARPIILTRVFNDGIEGQTGMTEPVLALDEVPQAGDRIVLIAPTTPGTLRFNIGIRTLAEGAAISYTVRSSAGEVRRIGTREFPTQYFVQQSAADFLGVALEASDSVEFRIVRGAAAIYGATTDNVTQDPSLQINRR